MDRNSTPFLLFEDIVVSNIDLVADAFNIDTQLEVLLGHSETDYYEPDDGLISRIIAVL